MTFDSTQVAQTSRSRSKGNAASARLQLRQRVTVIVHGVGPRVRVQEVITSRVLGPSIHVRENLGLVISASSLATEGRA